MLAKLNARITLRILFFACLVLGVALAGLSIRTPQAALAQAPGPVSQEGVPDAPAYIYSLSPTSATQSTYEVKLTISNCMGVAPPSSRWYGPGGSMVSPTCSGSSNLIRQYEYIGGSLYQVIDHFYISACNRPPGSYHVEVGYEYTGYFSISSPQPTPTSVFAYLPLMLTKTWQGAPDAFAKLSPADASEYQSLSPILDWEGSRGATAYAYCYDTTDDDACSNWMEAGTASQASLGDLSELTTYYWQARAVNSLGTTYADGAETAFWSFTTGEVLSTTWVEMTAAAEWSARGGHRSVALPDGSIVLMGGDDGDKKNDVWRSIDQGATWTLMTAAAEWSARSAHTSVVLTDGSIVLMGGYDGSSRQDDVWRSTDQGATWTLVTDDAPWTARNAHTSVALPDGSIVLMAGYSGSSYLQDVWRSTDQGATWTQMSSSPGWAGRTSAASAALPDGSIVIMGGYTGSTYPNDVWRSTNQGATWTQMTGDAEWTGRTSAVCVALPGGDLMLMGGSGDGYKNDVWQSTDQGATWSLFNASAEWSARWHHTAVALPDGSIVLMGGGVSTSTLYNDVWRLGFSD